jgi:hypothetical protein
VVALQPGTGGDQAAVAGSARSVLSVRNTPMSIKIVLDRNQHMSPKLAAADKMYQEFGPYVRFHPDEILVANDEELRKVTEILESEGVRYSVEH